MNKADLILTNGKVCTLWDDRPWVSALAVGDGRVLAAGDDAEIAEFRGSETEVVDLEGKTVVPGFTDSHNHLLYYGQTALLWADLGGCRSIDEILDRLREHAQSGNVRETLDPHPGPLPARERGSDPTEWILGIGFDHEILAERRMPTKDDLDKVSADRPIFIVRLCGHACVANSKAIELAGPERLPESGRKTGLLTEDDQGPVWEKIPDPSFDKLVEAALFAARKARSTGIVSVHALVNSMDEFNAFKQLHDRGELPIRLYMQPSLGMMDKLIADGWTHGMGDDMFRMGTAKIFADGSMGARTAAMVDDYTDDPGNKGWLLHTDEAMTDMVRRVHKAGWQAAVHAIGDKAIEQVADAIETVLNETGESNLVRRHRVEHASILSENLINRMAELKIFAAVQPQFVLTDWWTIERVGPERYRWTYPFKTMLEAGIPTSFGSDCPVERVDAFELIYRAVTRDTHSPSECLTVEEAVRVYCTGGPLFAFEEDRRGTLRPGMLADMVVLDRDIFTIPQEEIPNCKAEMVYVGGK
jgi:predicted amidohydrolase YtcJ